MSAAQPDVPVLVITGATGSGKTALVKALFAGKHAVRPAEVISADSMQVYCGMNIGTAKPSPALQRVLPHHLIDIRQPDEQFNAGDFARLAQKVCLEIAGRGALPVVCGGSLFYLNALLRGIPESPPSSPELRARLKTELRSRGAAALAEELARCDNASARRIHPHDEYRLLRALEVFRLCGQPLSAFRQNAPAEDQPLRFTVFAASRPRPDLYRRIDERTARMLAGGLRAEVAALFAQGHTPRAPGLKAIGYREFFCETPAGEYQLLPETLDTEIAQTIARNTRRYAKRQLTWLRSLPEARPLPLDNEAALAAFRFQISGFSR
ncbi:MAG: tRNA (adenosine(37)-N6)-dimethylallyltransferase MiaA [Spirochaetaceae bacterium]|jgi:tRNA dimethylallyltransferase|nr:tRNA (adenosine(37)-N6)-dimethylallyltransferase MiaA [Spirochaetaceae bacterium]